MASSESIEREIRVETESIDGRMANALLGASADAPKAAAFAHECPCLTAVVGILDLKRGDPLVWSSMVKIADACEAARFDTMVASRADGAVASFDASGGNRAWIVDGVRVELTLPDGTRYDYTQHRKA